MFKVRLLLKIGEQVQRPLLVVFAGLSISCLVLTAVAGYWGAQVAESVFWGCLVFALPTLYFTLYAFRYKGSQQVALMARSFYWGQASKLSLMAMGFALVFVFVKPLIVSALFAGFCLMIPAHLVVAMFVSKGCAAVSGSAGR